MPISRQNIMLSGFYGFGNLGDEAILEELIVELSQLTDRENIVVLSNDPKNTEAIFGVKAYDRWNLFQIYNLFQRTRLFVSGGGGLFQDSSSWRSVFYYATLHHLARLAGVETLVYAQGLGPLNLPFSRFLTKCSFSLADKITVRDDRSKQWLEHYRIPAVKTADPVWCLKPGPVPNNFSEELKKRRKGDNHLLIGLSLREVSHLDKNTQDELIEALLESLPSGSVLVPLVMQKEKDASLLTKLADEWKEKGGDVLDMVELEKPSSWLAVIGSLDLVIGMRLHSLIMALSSEVPTIGLSYDPKVENVMKEFGQPFLNLINEEQPIPTKSGMVKQLKTGLARRQESLESLKVSLEEVRRSACMNFQFLDRILSK